MLSLNIAASAPTTVLAFRVSHNGLERRIRFASRQAFVDTTMHEL